VDFIVLGCDGLYEEWQNEDIISYVKNGFDQKTSIKDIIEGLVSEAIDRGSADNVTAIIIKFEKAYKKLLSTGKFVKKTVKVDKGKAEVTEESSTLIRKKSKNSEKQKSKQHNTDIFVKKKGTPVPSNDKQPPPPQTLSKSSLIKRNEGEKEAKRNKSSSTNNATDVNRVTKIKNVTPPDYSPKIKKTLQESHGQYEGHHETLDTHTETQKKLDV